MASDTPSEEKLENNDRPDNVIVESNDAVQVGATNSAHCEVAAEENSVPQTAISIETPTETGTTAEGGQTDHVDGAVSSAEEARRTPRRSRRNSSRCRSRNHQRTNMISRVRHLQHKHGLWTCFFCCHVTTGTIIIGAWDMVLHLLALSLLAMVAIYPSHLNSFKDGNGGPHSYRDDFFLLTVAQDVQAVNCTKMPCFMATQHEGNGGRQRVANYPNVAPDFPLALGHLMSVHQLNSEGESVSVFITLCTMVVTLLLLYGVYKQQPSHLIPFFFLQIFDFCLSSMTMLGYISYLPNLRQILEKSPPFPFKEDLLSMQTNCLTFFVMLVFIAIFMVKAYCINIVWRCYKYLLLCRASAAGGRESTSSNSTSAPARSSGNRCTAPNPPPEHCMQWLLQQEFRTKMSGAYPEPPPSYDMAMATTFTPSEGPTAGGVGNDDAPLLPPYEQAIQQERANPDSPPVAASNDAPRQV